MIAEKPWLKRAAPIYFVPLDNVGGGAGYNGEVIRYDTQSDFQQAISWLAYDSAVHGTVAQPHGYFEAAYDGRYVYFGPYMRQGVIPYSQVLRYDTQLGFQDSLAWNTFDPGAQGVGQTPGGYRGVVYDCKSIYFVPFLSDYWSNPRKFSTETLRYDTQREFQSTAAWSAYNPVAAGGWNIPQGYDGAVFDGRYVYFVPTHDNPNHGHFLRYDTWIGSPDVQGNGIPDSCEGHSPIMVSSPVTAAVAGSAYTYDVDATDPDAGSVLAYSLTTAPAGMTIASATGLIAWAPNPAQVGNHNVTVRVSDQGGLYAEQSFTIVVTAAPPTNRAPSITSMAITAATAGAAYAYPVTATDPDAGDVLTYSLPTAPTGMSIAPTTGLITWTPTPAQVGVHPVTARVTDQGGLFAEQPFTITVTAAPPVNQAPVITSTPLTAATADVAYAYPITATDPNPSDVLTYSLTTAPAGMTINAATGLITWTPTTSQTGDHPVTVKVQDAGGLFATQSYTLTVTATAVCVPPPPGLVSWWPGDGNALDRAAANDGIAENGASYAAGLVGQAFRFDGVDDLIRIANGRTIGFSGPFSIEFWFNPATTIDASAPNHVLLAKGQYPLGGASAPQAIQTLAGDGRLFVSLPPPYPATTTDTWLAGVWQHIALTWDGARYRLYVNGVEEGSADNPVSILDNAAALTLGWDGSFANSAYAGLLDETSLYNRALSPAEVAALHAARGLGKCTAGYSRADAGPDQAVEVGATVTLDGSASRAFDGTPLSYQWTLTSRPASSSAVLANPTTINPTFIADQAGT